MDYLFLGIPLVAGTALACLFLNKRGRAYQTIPITLGNANQKSNINKQDIQNQQKNKQRPGQTTKQQKPCQVIQIKKIEELQKQYVGLFYGSFRLKGDKSVHAITALDFKGSKVLITTTKNQMILFNLKTWKKDAAHSAPQKYFVSLDNNGASAVCIGQNYYYVALAFDKTIVYYQFKGQNGIYFKQVCKFPRNIYKSNASTIHASKNQTYIITTGSGNDTVIDIWSMKGQRLASTNSFQIEHYNITYGSRNVLIRGWTSQVKIFTVLEQKDGSFKKLEKGQHLPHQQSPLQSAIDNRDMYAMSISKNHKIKIWYLYDTVYHKTTQSSPIQHAQLFSNQIDKCGLFTFQPAVDHFKTVVVVAHRKGFYVTDTNLTIINKVEGVDVKDIYLNGTNKSVILGVINNNGQLSLWNLTKEMEKISQAKI